MAANHILPAGKFDQPASGFNVGIADGFGNFHDGDVVGVQFFTVDSDLVLILKTANGRDLSHSGHGLQGIAKIPILKRSQVGQTVRAAFVHKGILVYPPDSGGIGPDFGLNLRRQRGNYFAEIFEHTAARPINIRAVFEDDVDVGKTEIGIAADCLYFWRPEQSRRDRIRHLVFDDIRGPVPTGVDNDLRIREVGDSVNRLIVEGPYADRHDRSREYQDYELLPGAPVNDFFYHNSATSLAGRVIVIIGHAYALQLPPETEAFSFDSESRRKFAPVTTFSPSETPCLISYRFRTRTPSVTSRGSNTPFPLATKTIFRSPVAMTALSGTAIPFPLAPPMTTSAYISGFNSLPGFANSRRALTVRVAGSTVGLMKVTRPRQVFPG